MTPKTKNLLIRLVLAFAGFALALYERSGLTIGVFGFLAMGLGYEFGKPADAAAKEPSHESA